MSVLELIPEEKSKNNKKRNNVNCRQVSEETSNSIPSSGAPYIQQRSSLKNVAGHTTSQKKYKHQLLSSKSSPQNITDINQRLVSAKKLRVKEIQNELQEAKYQLHELTTENRILRNIQKRQDNALSKYENNSSALPRLLENHSAEVNAIRAHARALRTATRDLQRRLSRSDAELANLKIQYAKLKKLVDDKELLPRTELQKKLEDSEHRIRELEDKNSILNRKLEIDNKRHLQQLKSDNYKRQILQRELTTARSEIDRLNSLLTKVSYMPRQKSIRQAGSTISLLQGKEVSKQFLKASASSSDIINVQDDSVVLSAKEPYQKIPEVPVKKSVSSESKLISSQKSSIEEIKEEVEISPYNDDTFESSPTHSQSQSESNDVVVAEVTKEPEIKYTFSPENIKHNIVKKISFEETVEEITDPNTKIEEEKVINKNESHVVKEVQPILSFSALKKFTDSSDNDSKSDDVLSKSSNSAKSVATRVTKLKHDYIKKLDKTLDRQIRSLKDMRSSSSCDDDDIPDEYKKHMDKNAKLKKLNDDVIGSKNKTKLKKSNSEKNNNLKKVEALNDFDSGNGSTDKSSDMNIKEEKNFNNKSNLRQIKALKPDNLKNKLKNNMDANNKIAYAELLELDESWGTLHDKMKLDRELIDLKLQKYTQDIANFNISSVDGLKLNTEHAEVESIEYIKETININDKFQESLKKDRIDSGKKSKLLAALKAIDDGGDIEEINSISTSTFSLLRRQSSTGSQQNDFIKELLE